jgi:dTDP-4-dehydrorhamnose reductase
MKKNLRVFITGSTGLLGSAILRQAPDHIKLGASYHVNKFVPNLLCQYYFMDLTKKSTVMEAIETFKPDVVIHTAAIAAPDYCDKHQDEAVEVNTRGTQRVIAACKKVGAKIVFITTNGVYDGKKPPYDETALPKPIDCYGITKYDGEKMVAESGLEYAIVRLITMYGWNNPHERQNPVTWLIKMLGENKTSVNMVTDMFNNFLYVEQAAEAIWKVVTLGKWGQSYNIAGKDCISRFDFSISIAKEFKLDEKMIFPTDLKSFKNFVPRPANTCFITTKMETELAVKPLLSTAGLKHMKKNPLPEKTWKSL